MINPHIGIAGNIGAGKTTLTEKLTSKFDWEPIYESVVDNPYLEDFYEDMSKWSFNLQIYFLNHRFQNQVTLSSMNKGFVQDRTIYEDKEIFAKNLRDLNFLSDRDWKTYENLFDNMTDFIREPDLIIYLKASTDTLLSRIQGRSRDFEKNIDPEYIHSLNIYYDKWIASLDQRKTLVVKTDNFNIFKDKERLDEIFKLIKSRIDSL
tara:strand:- start:35 stop:655 length:621 start_codon:yes stop_codon:yes gene_type:complete